MVVSEDMPRLTTGDCKALMTTHAGAAAGIAAGDVNVGCRGLPEKQPERLFPVEREADGYFVDLDPPPRGLRRRAGVSSRTTSDRV